MSCSGAAQYSTTDLALIPLNLSCSDGTNGKTVVVLNRATYLKDFTGVGKGKLSNGEQFQIIIGPLGRSINW